jgi:Bacterial PH domain
VFSPQQSRDRQVFRSAGSIVLWWGWLAFAVASLVAIAVSGHGHSSAVAAVTVLAITGVVYACAFWPRIVADENGISVLNPVRAHEVPWAAVTKVDLVNALRVHCAPAPGAAQGTIIHSWAVQSSGRARQRGEIRARRAADQAARRPAGYGRPPPEAASTLNRTSAEFVARQLDERAARERGSAASAPAAGGPHGGPAGAAPPRVTWAWVQIAAMALPLLALIIVILT